MADFGQELLVRMRMLGRKTKRPNADKGENCKTKTGPDVLFPEKA